MTAQAHRAKYWVRDEALQVLTLDNTGTGHRKTPLLVLGDDAAHMMRWAVHAALDEGRTVFVPSLPAHRAHGASVADVVHAIATWLADANVRCVDIFAEGRGAAVAHLFIRVHGARVRRLILCGFGLPLRKRHQPQWRPLLAELTEAAEEYDLDRKVARGGDVLLLDLSGNSEFSESERHRLAAAYPGSFREVVPSFTRFAGRSDLEAAVATFLERPEPTAFP